MNDSQSSEAKNYTEGNEHDTYLFKRVIETAAENKQPLLNSLEDNCKTDIEQRLDLARKYASQGTGDGYVKCRDILLDILTYAESKEMLNVAAICCAQVGPQEKLVELYRRIASRADAVPHDYTRLSQCLAGLGHHAEAAKYLEKAATVTIHDKSENNTRKKYIKDLISNFPVYECLEQILDASIRDPMYPAWIMLEASSIGEVAWTCALAEAFVQAHGHKIIFVIPSHHADIAFLWKHRFHKILVANQDIIANFLCSGFIDPNRFELDYPIGINCCHLGFPGESPRTLHKLIGWPGRGRLSQIDLQRLAFRLPWNAKLEKCTIPQAWEHEAKEYAKAVGLEAGKSVVLFPINNSNVMLPKTFWDAVADQLCKMGYKVFVNTLGAMSTCRAPLFVDNATPITLPIRLALPIVQMAGKVIIGLNGFQVLTTLCELKNVDITVLLPLQAALYSETINCGAIDSFSPFQNAALLTHVQWLANQYQLPELATDSAVTEFLVDRDYSLDVLKSLAVAIANQDVEHPACFKRYTGRGNLYSEENIDWLKLLV